MWLWRFVKEKKGYVTDASNLVLVPLVFPPPVSRYSGQVSNGAPCKRWFDYSEHVIHYPYCDNHSLCESVGRVGRISNVL